MLSPLVDAVALKWRLCNIVRVEVLCKEQPRVKFQAPNNSDIKLFKRSI